MFVWDKKGKKGEKHTALVVFFFAKCLYQYKWDFGVGGYQNSATWVDMT